MFPEKFLKIVFHLPSLQQMKAEEEEKTLAIAVRLFF
jgi:hypothetical protein